MKKTYIKPVTENIACLQDRQLMMHSDDHIGAKDMNFDDDSEEKNDLSIKNLWDD